jgi:uncharacterized membrane protein
MSTLTLLKFPTVDGAQKMESTLLDLQKQSLIEVRDAGIVTWRRGAKQPKTQQVYSLAGAGSISGAFWGILFGLIFWEPFFGVPIGADAGALRTKFNDYGIDDKFIRLTQEKVTEGTSALLLLTTDAVLDKLVEAMKGQTFEVIATNLPKEKEDELRAAFGAE